MNIIHLPLQNQRSHPVVCFVDLQVEYVTQGRALAVEETEPWMSNCRRLLTFAREQRMPIAHFRQLRRGAFLNQATEFSSWIEEFRPRPSEMVFERGMPSCYSAGGFASITENMDNPILVLAGLTSSGACLATAIESYHRQHSALFISDASWSQPIGSATATASHDFASDLIGQYCDVMSSDGLVEWLSRARIGMAS